MRQVEAIAALVEGMDEAEKLELIGRLQEQTAKVPTETSLENMPVIELDEDLLMQERMKRSLMQKWHHPNKAEILRSLQEQDAYSYARATGQE